MPIPIQIQHKNGAVAVEVARYDAFLIDRKFFKPVASVGRDLLNYMVL